MGNYIHLNNTIMCIYKINNSYVVVYIFKGDVLLLNSTQVDRHIKYCLNEYYYFRCDLVGSIQDWEINGVQVERYAINSVPLEQRPEEPKNTLLYDLVRGDTERDTKYISYLWFNSSINVSSVTCRSVVNSTSIFMRLNMGKLVCAHKITS